MATFLDPYKEWAFNFHPSVSLSLQFFPLHLPSLFFSLFLSLLFSLSLSPSPPPPHPLHLCPCLLVPCLCNPKVQPYCLLSHQFYVFFFSSNQSKPSRYRIPQVRKLSFWSQYKAKHYNQFPTESS